MKKTFIGLALVALCATNLQGQDLRRVAINEIAWAGTQASPNDEWLELVNNTDREIDLTGWVLRWGEELIRIGPIDKEVENSAQEVRRTVIPARGFYLLERSDDTTVSDVEADVIYTGSLRNDGEKLELLDERGILVDSANGTAETGWLAGTGNGEPVPYATMERINARGPDTADNWASNNGTDRQGKDAKDNGLNGTPKARNSQTR